MTTSPRRDGSELLDRIVPLWRETLPSTVPRVYFDRFIARNRDELIRRFDALAGTPHVRPRAGREAVKALDRRLGFMPKRVRVGNISYHSATWVAHEEEIEIMFQSDRTEKGEATMILHAAPRVDDELDIRGTLQNEDGETVCSFDWEVIPHRELILLRETLLARWFHVTTTPERRMAPSMLEALAVLRAEEDASNGPEQTHPWTGVHDLTRDALIARGLADVLVTPGRPPHYQTTPAGRQRLAETNTLVTHHLDLAAIAREEARMGAKLRAGRDQEEGAFTESLQRGMAHEASHGRTGWNARSTVFKNLDTDPHFYDKRPPASGPRFTPAIVYPLKFSNQSLANLFSKLGGSNMPARLHVGGYDFDRTSVTIDEIGFVLVVYRTAARDNPRTVTLANGIETKPFIPGPLVVFLTPKGTEAIFSIELQRHDGHQVVSSNWVKGSIESILGLTSAEVMDLVGLEKPKTQHA